MAVTSKVYGLAMQSILNKEIDFDTDTVKVSLHTSAYTPDQDTHRYRNATGITTSEITGTGYTVRGQALTSKTVTYSTSTNTLTLTCASPSWAASTLTARYAIFYVDTATDSTSPLLCYWDFGADMSSSSGPFTLTIPGTGLLTLTTA